MVDIYYSNKNQQSILLIIANYFLSSTAYECRFVLRRLSKNLHYCILIIFTPA